MCFRLDGMSRVTRHMSQLRGLVVAVNNIMSASTATVKRRSTVYDFSTLRLHQDGSRVAIHSPARVDLRNSRLRNTGRDTRGNRFARDAAGLGAVPKRIVRREDDSSNDRPNASDGEDIEMRKTKPRMPLRKKRRRIDENVEFLGDSRNSAAIVTNGESTNWPVPSSVRYPIDHFPYATLLPFVRRTC